MQDIYLTEFGVDAGMIGAIPLSSVEELDNIDLGLVMVVPAGKTLRHEYDNGTMVFTVGVGGGVEVLPKSDEEWWIGDLCYVLKDNWTVGPAPKVGYWAACEQSFRTPRQGMAGSLPFPLADGRYGLVHGTAYGDGCYPGELTRDEGGRMERLVIYTGDDGQDWGEEEE